MRHHRAGGGAEPPPGRDGRCRGHEGEDHSGEQGRRHGPGRIPEAPQRTGHPVRIRKRRIRKGVRGDFRQAGQVEGLYAVHQRASKAGRVLQGL